MAKGGGSAKTVDNSKDMFNLLTLTVIAVVLFLYSKVLQNRKYWIYVEIGLGVFCTIMLPVAGVMMSYVTGEKSDDLTTFLLRLILVSLVAQAAAVYFSDESVDRTVPIAVSISNILIRAPLLLIDISLMTSSSSKIPDKVRGYAYPDILGIVLLLVGDLYHLVNSKTSSYSHRTVGDPVSFHLSIDALINFFLGSMILGFSDMFYFAITPSLTIQPLHLLLAKGFGILLLGGSLLSFASLCYRDDDDAVATLKTRLVVYLSAALLGLTNILVDSHFRTFGHTGVMLGVMGGLALNAGLMVYKHEKQD